VGGDEVPSNADRVDLDRLQQVFEGFSLTGSEARTLVALLRLGSAPLNQLCHTTGISRSNLYPVLDSLQARGLGHRLPGRYAVWTTSGAEAVLAVLEAADAARAEEARKAAQRRLEEARTRLAELPTPVEETPSVISLTDGGRLAVAYLEAMNWVDNEILVFNRGPYPGDIEPDEAVLGALARGVKARALWQSAELEDPDGVRRVADDYARAGVDQRVVAAGVSGRARQKAEPVVAAERRKFVVGVAP